MANRTTLAFAAGLLAIGITGCGKSVPKSTAQSTGLSSQCMEMGLKACEQKGIELLGSDTKQAVLYLRGACDLSRHSACLELGQQLLTQKNGPKALSVLNKSCGLGFGPSCHSLGGAYRLGFGDTPVNKSKSLAAYERGCKLKHQASCFSAGTLHLSKDPDLGMKMMVAACKAGHTKGCKLLAETGNLPALPQARCGPNNPDACIELAMKRKSPSAQLGTLGWACKKEKVAKACFVAAGIEARMVAKGEVGFEAAEAKAALARGCKLSPGEACDGARTLVGIHLGGAGGKRKMRAVKSNSKRLVGINWIMPGHLADRLRIKKVTCQEPFRNNKMCRMTLVATDAFGRRETVWATIFDRDGAQTGRIVARTPERPGTIKQRIRVGVDTKRVEFDF